MNFPGSLPSRRRISRRNALSLSVRWADASFSTEIPIRYGARPSSSRDANPSPRPPGPAKRSTTPNNVAKSSPCQGFILACIAGKTKEARRIVVDIVNQETRSRMMAGIRGKDTKPEMILRKALHARGLRYRLHARHVPGRPDLVLAKYRAAIFAHGCFWHHHEGCRYATMPATRPDFWKEKFAANIRRDRDVRRILVSRGWRVATVWECALRNPDLVTVTIESVVSWLNSEQVLLDLGVMRD